MTEKVEAQESVAVTQKTAGDVIAYIGTSDWRAIYEADWLAIDIKGKDRMWDESNMYEIPVKDLTAAERKWLVEDVDDFVQRAASSPVATLDVDATPDPATHDA